MPNNTTPTIGLELSTPGVPANYLVTENGNKEKIDAAFLNTAHQMYTHTRTGSGPYVHNLTGAGNYLSFKATGDNIQGDTWIVNGKVLSVVGLSGIEIGTNAVLNGDFVQGILLENLLILKTRQVKTYLYTQEVSQNGTFTIPGFDKRKASMYFCEFTDISSTLTGLLTPGGDAITMNAANTGVTTGDAMVVMAANLQFTSDTTLKLIGAFTTSIASPSTISKQVQKLAKFGVVV